MFNFGVDYYPEHWPRERWETDANLMAKAGVNIVRLAEFAWVKMEPSDGRFDFGWLDEAIGILKAQGIRVILGTPTASPPAWLMSKDPALFRVREDGVRLPYGNRREYCPNHPTYQDYSRRIVEKMAEHYAGNDAVIGWQIDNEFGDRCYCAICQRAFQNWLCQRYGTLDKLNAEWGTIFWSHTYNDWSEIPVPLTTVRAPNPALGLDFYRFMSDSYVAYQQIQIDVLRERCPNQFITHNLMGFGYDQLNYFDLTRGLDFVTWDNYRRMQWTFNKDVDPGQAALAADAMRGLKRKNFWVMEQQAGSGGWDMVSVAPRPGELRLWAYQQIAHGADGIVFFRWRTALFGTEQYWHGLLDHDGHTGRRYGEAKQLGGEMKDIGSQILGAEVKALVAMVLSYDSRFAFQIQSNNTQFSYSGYFYQIYQALNMLNVPVDVVAPTDDLSGYKLVIAPTVYVLPQAAAENLEDYVKAGGTLVSGFRSGVKDEYNAVVNMRLPGLFRSVMGVSVEEYDSLTADMTQPLQFSDPTLAGTAAIWCDVLAAESAEVVGRYTADYYAGKPAITLNKYGQGQAVYIGTHGNQRLYDTLVPWLLKLARIEAPISTPAGVELAERWHGDRRLLFLLNHTNQSQRVTVPGTFTTLLGKEYGTGDTFDIPAREVVIVSL